MSAEFPEPVNPRKKLLQSRYPILETFVDESARVDKIAWIKVLKSAYSSVYDDLHLVIGEEKTSRDVEMLCEKAKNNDVYYFDVEDGDKDFLTAVISSIGFKLGNKSDVYLFYGDIYQQLVFSNTMENSNESSFFVLQALMTGVIWNEQIIAETPDIFTNFKFDLD